MEKIWSRRGGLLSLSSTAANLLFRSNLSTSTSTVTKAASAEATKPKRKKKNKKNLFEVAQFLPNWGIGYHLAKSHWNGVSYQITKLNLYKVSTSLPSLSFLLLQLPFWFLGLRDFALSQDERERGGGGGGFRIEREKFVYVCLRERQRERRERFQDGLH